MKKQKCKVTQLSQMQSVGAAIREVVDAEGHCVIEFGPEQQSRSLAQNRLLWKWHGELQNHLYVHRGIVKDTEEIHEHVVAFLLPKKASELKGDIIVLRAKTSKLSTKDFQEFLEKYQAWAVEEENLQFTHPEDLYFEAMGIKRAA